MVLLRIVVFVFLALRILGGIEFAFGFASVNKLVSIFALAVASGYAAALVGILRREIWGYWFAVVLILLDILGGFVWIFAKPQLIGLVIFGLGFDILFLSAVVYLMRGEAKGGKLRR